MLKTIARQYVPRGVRQALAHVKTEAAIARRHHRGVRDARRYATQRDLRIQLGSGGQSKPGWVNVDLFAEADVQLDLREPLPFADNSAREIYAEHVLEHFVYPGEVRHVLSEIARVLAPGGVFRLVVPHAGRALTAYGTGDTDFFAARGVRSYLARERPTPMHIVNYSFRQDGQHKYAYDEETLGQVLNANGLTGSRVRAFDPALDSERRHAAVSLYMEAFKPWAPGG